MNGLLIQWGTTGLIEGSTFQEVSFCAYKSIDSYVGFACQQSPEDLFPATLIPGFKKTSKSTMKVGGRYELYNNSAYYTWLVIGLS